MGFYKKDIMNIFTSSGSRNSPESEVSKAELRVEIWKFDELSIFIQNPNWRLLTLGSDPLTNIPANRVLKAALSEFKSKRKKSTP